MKRILIHICCGPCSIMPIQLLRSKGYNVVGYFANPNIHPMSEYLRRREATAEAAKKMDLPIVWGDDTYNLQQWLTTVHNKNIADNKNGLRCHYCYESRLALTQQVAIKYNFDTFTTSLLYSIYQNQKAIIQSAEIIEVKHPYLPFLYENFQSDWQKGIDLSKEWGLFRQNYCGCVYSETKRFQKKFNKLLSNSTSNIS